jgi:multidrug transporter EmrE-like cation transporter
MMSNVARWISGPLLLAAYTLASSVGLVLIKSGLIGTASLSFPAFVKALSSPAFITGIFLYTFSFAAWIGVLASMPLSTAYPLAIGMTMASSTLGAAAFLGEWLGFAKLGGIAFVFAAVVLIAIGSKR